MVGPAARLIAGVAAAWLAASAMPPAAAQEFRVVAHCRDGHPHGIYELRSAAGQVRVTGAFNRGKRTSSFLFWSGSGVRVAHIPFDDDRISGTVSLWYADASPNRESQQKLEAAFAAGRRNGATRSWYPDGRLRAVFEYRNGDLIAAEAWSASGAPMPAEAARALAAQDRAEDERYYASLDAIVTAHLPNCEAAAPTLQRTRAAGPSYVLKEMR